MRTAAILIMTLSFGSSGTASLQTQATPTRILFFFSKTLSDISFLSSLSRTSVSGAGDLECYRWKD